MKVKVEVTNEHIAEGKPFCLDCPVAIAVNELTIPKVLAQVNDEDIDFIHSDPEIKNIAVELPKRARSFVFCFDSGSSVKPFSFALNIPKKYLQA